MKKTITMILTVILIFSIGSAFTESKAFDLSVVENLPGYEYDKMDKSWRAFNGYIEQFSDACIVVAIRVYGDKSFCYIPELYCWIREANNRDKLVDVTEIKIMIGDKLYAAKPYVDETSSTAFLAQIGKELVKDISESDEMLIRLVFKTNSIDLEIDAQKDYADLKKFCKALIDTDVWSYIDDSDVVDTMESMFGFSVE